MESGQVITMSRDELEELVEAACEKATEKAVQKAFHEIGIRNDELEHIDEAREDFRFIRRLRKGYDGAASKIGGTVILALVSGFGWLLWLGTQALISAKTGAPTR